MLARGRRLIPQPSVQFIDCDLVMGRKGMQGGWSLEDQEALAVSRIRAFHSFLFNQNAAAAANRSI